MMKNLSIALALVHFGRTDQVHRCAWQATVRVHAAAAQMKRCAQGRQAADHHHGIIENGVVVMQDGKITAVGGAGSVNSCRRAVIDVTGMTVYPGLIDSETQLGLTEISADRMTND